MKPLLSILISCFLSASMAFADGIPVDRKTLKVTVPHTVLTLSESQTEEIETLGTLTLSTDQWRRLRRIGPACPKRIETVFPVTWSDCTCGAGFYAIQLNRDKVAVTHSDLQYATTNVFERELKENKSVLLNVDSRGQFYHEGVLIPFSRLLKLTSASDGGRSTRDDDERRQLWIKLPFETQRDSAVVKTRLDQLLEAAKRARWLIPQEEYVWTKVQKEGDE